MLLDLECRAFNPPDFEEVVRQAAKMAPHAAMPDQVRYLSYYLSHEEMGARSMLIERPYIDRHYLTEYQGYYATTLSPSAR